MTQRCLAATIMALPRLKPRPDSLMPHDARLREWFKDVRDYCRHPFLLKQAIQWRLAALEAGGPRGGGRDATQVTEALGRLRALAGHLGMEVPSAA